MGQPRADLPPTDCPTCNPCKPCEACKTPRTTNGLANRHATPTQKEPHHDACRPSPRPDVRYPRHRHHPGGAGRTHRRHRRAGSPPRPDRLPARRRLGRPRSEKADAAGHHFPPVLGHQANGDRRRHAAGRRRQAAAAGPRHPLAAGFPAQSPPGSPGDADRDSRTSSPHHHHRAADHPHQRTQLQLHGRQEQPVRTCQSIGRAEHGHQSGRKPQTAGQRAAGLRAGQGLALFTVHRRAGWRDGGRNPPVTARHRA